MSDQQPTPKKRRREERAPRLKLEVTQEIIDAACGRDSSHCMLAEAIKVAFPAAANVSVDLQTMRFTDPVKKRRYTYLTPRVCQVAIVQFDQHLKPSPFTVRIRNGQVTEQKRHPSDSPEKRRARKRLSPGGSGNHPDNVPDVLGGQPPPLQKTHGSEIPFSRRREFGLRALSR